MSNQGEDQESEVNDLIQMLEDVEQRLVENASGPAPTGRTDPDPGGTERWEAAQVWGHMAEFMPYWLDQLDKVISQYGGQPVPFGRTKADAGRLEGIAAGLNVPIAQQMAQVHQAIEMACNYLATLTPEQWQAIGLHARRGEMGVGDIMKAFILDHLEEHADQLDALV